MTWTRIVPPINVTQVENASGVIINPATEEKQDIIIVALGDGVTGTPSSVAASATSGSLLAANTDRVSAIIRNDTNRTMYVEYGATATLTSALEVDREDIIVIDDYLGEISAIWDSGVSGAARITENAR